MEFWGAEVKPGQKLKCRPEIGKLIHISQAAMGDVKDPKGPDAKGKNIALRMTIEDRMFVIGSLSVGERTQLMFDLVFEKEFELSHDLKSASIYFIGYMANDPDNEAFSDFDDEDENAELPLEPQVNGPAKAVKENKVLMIEHNGSKKEVLDDDSEEEDDDNAFLGEERAIGDSDGSDDEGEDESSESEEVELELTPAKQSSKKRGVAGSAEKTSEAKRAKSSALEKGKKVLNSTPTPTPTPAPSKSAGPSSSKSAGKKQQTPKSHQFKQQTPKSHKSKAKHGGKHIGK